MNGKHMSGEITGKEISNAQTTGTNGNNATERITGTNMPGDSIQAQLLLPRGAHVDRPGSRRKKFQIGWLLPVAALCLFLGHFWSYIPVFRGIISLLVLSKILTGAAPGAFLL